MDAVPGISDAMSSVGTEFATTILRGAASEAGDLPFLPYPIEPERCPDHDNPVKGCTQCDVQSMATTRYEYEARRIAKLNRAASLKLDEETKDTSQDADATAMSLEQYGNIHGRRGDNRLVQDRFKKLEKSTTLTTCISSLRHRMVLKEYL